jgi:hypothetical protein
VQAFEWSTSGDHLFVIRVCLIEHLSGQCSCTLEVLPGKRQHDGSPASIFFSTQTKSRWFFRFHLPEMLAHDCYRKNRSRAGKVRKVPCLQSLHSVTACFRRRLRKVRVLRMKYIADYVISHLGSKHSGTLVLRGEGSPRVDDILDAVCRTSNAYSD